MKTFRFFLIPVCFFVLSFASAQQLQHKKDSITFLLKNASNDSLYVTHAMDLGILTDTSNPTLAQQYFNNSLDKLNSNYTYANKEEMIALAYDCLGIIERRKGNFDTALEYYLKALKVKQQSKDQAKIGRSYHNIAMLFSAKREYDKAISYMELALPLRTHDSIDYGISLHNYGNFYYKKKNYDKAIEALDKAQLYLLNDKIRTADVNTVYARIYRAKKQYNKALSILKTNLGIYTKSEKIERKATTYKSIATCYRRLKEYRNALIYLDSSEILSQQYENKKIISLINLDRYRIYKAKNDYKKALEKYRLYKKYNDSVFSLKQIEKIAALELAYQEDKKLSVDKLSFETNKKLLQAEAKNQRIQKQLYAALLILTLISLSVLFLFFRQRRKVYQNQLKEQELETELLNEKVVSLRYKIDRLLADHKMRSDFKEDLLLNVKKLQSQNNSKELLQQYQSMLSQIEHQVRTEKRLDEISKEQQLKNEGFELKLSKLYPQLTKSEREICNLIYLNLSIKEIMNIRNVTLSSVKSARYRIRKKLEIPKEIELEYFIQNIH
ncbi:tetratricopeptide repeat protein [uncultured Tenacibaculum sp.]|uniref:tetratricopeptide repeat protein n=1 Tax=uncultured Tenacibaculum sp. TaxID=174713 RepID=UPI00261FCBB9|nr:tetratricopeptide repeat protein [uncultured Tenacibaculum sp.]